jgi:hypothetical protein
LAIYSPVANPSNVILASKAILWGDDFKSLIFAMLN